MAAKPEATAAAGKEPCPCSVVWTRSPAAAAEHKRRQRSSKHRKEAARYKKRCEEFERLAKYWTLYVVLAAVFVLAALCLRHWSSLAAQVCAVMAAGWMLGVARVTTLLRRVFSRDDLFRPDYDEPWD
ncbi:hypothetical protein TRIUR3_13755 [Triticum urartu]|uniref:Uncharacterized protein n=1 Tax=Triticum urartu TaxID=4572 RepID=M8A5J5_TRIUA|nr:hypothetical protein TRIUR3_13755 [Triticum urartu]